VNPGTNSDDFNVLLGIGAEEHDIDLEEHHIDLITGNKPIPTEGLNFVADKEYKILLFK
jgi:hypothetical protein